MKVVYNACHGGFSVSDAGIMRYAEIAGFSLYPAKGWFGITTYWRMPENERPHILDGEEFSAAPMEERKASNQRYVDAVFCDQDLERDDPILIRVVEELGDKANGFVARLKIADVPTGHRYRIDEYDGFESVMTDGDYEWKVAS